MNTIFVLLMQACSCIFASKCISQHQFGQTEILLAAITYPKISKNQFCRSLKHREHEDL